MKRSSFKILLLFYAGMILVLACNSGASLESSDHYVDLGKESIEL